MTTYAVGDLQGCFTPLRRLLDRLDFEPRRDRLWFTGDLVNRGSESLAVLRFVRGLGDAAVTVLGNHDLHLLAAAKRGHAGPKDTFQDVLAAPDRDELLDWLRQQPLIHADADRKILMVHAGLDPAWDTDTALSLAGEVHTALQGKAGDEFLLKHMYGDGPAQWSDSLRGVERLRYIVNICTRMRFVDDDGRPDLRSKGTPEQFPALTPWFAHRNRALRGATVLFGHWSTLGRIHWPRHKVYGLDSGCVWGGRLTALNLDDDELIQEHCDACKKPGGDGD